MPPSVYIETSIVSYLTARPSRDLVVAARQQITQEWWDARRPDFEVFASDLVVLEARRGEADAADRRLRLLVPLPLLDASQGRELAESFVNARLLGPKAFDDALHIAAATVHGMDYLLTWNCTHIANAVILPTLEALSREMGYEPARVITPDQLMEGSHEHGSDR